MIVFDLDDTLYPEADYVQSGRKAVALHYESVTGKSSEQLLSIMNQADDAFESLADIVCKNKDAREEEIARMVEIYRNHTPNISLSHLTQEFLETLKSRGFAIGVISDGASSRQRAKIEALGLDKYINNDYICISEEIGADKHSPKPFVTLMNRREDDDLWVYIADNPAKDFLHPNLLGWHTVMLRDLDGRNIHRQNVDDLPSDMQPEYTIDSLNDLLQLPFF